MRVTVSKIAALLLASGYVVAAGISRDGLPFAATVAVGVVLPLALIWFPEEIGSWTRWRRGLRMRPSPAWMVAAMGWVFLVGIPLALVLWRGQR
jgi:hypothetical protein